MLIFLHALMHSYYDFFIGALNKEKPAVFGRVR